MKLQIKAKNFKVSDYLEQLIEKKFTKLGKYFNEDVQADIKISVDAGLEKLEATIRANGAIFRAEEISTDVYSTIETVTQRLEGQITRYKDKLISKHQQGGGILFDEIEDADDDDEDAEIDIVRTKRFAIKPMDAIEAALQMRLLNHSFFVFMDADTDQVCVVYERKDGKVGLIEPEYD